MRCVLLTVASPQLRFPLVGKMTLSPDGTPCFIRRRVGLLEFGIDDSPDDLFGAASAMLAKDLPECASGHLPDTVLAEVTDSWLTPLESSASLKLPETAPFNQEQISRPGGLCNDKGSVFLEGLLSMT